jgi:hypothetical protein
MDAMERHLILQFGYQRNYRSCICLQEEFLKAKGQEQPMARV